MMALHAAAESDRRPPRPRSCLTPQAHREGGMGEAPAALQRTSRDRTARVSHSTAPHSPGFFSGLRSPVQTKRCSKHCCQRPVRLSRRCLSSLPSSRTSRRYLRPSQHWPRIASRCHWLQRGHGMGQAEGPDEQAHRDGGRQSWAVSALHGVGVSYIQGSRGAGGGAIITCRQLRHPPAGRPAGSAAHPHRARSRRSIHAEP